MANFLPNKRVIIAKHSLTNSLEYLREPLRKIEQSYKSDSLSYNSAADSLDSDSQKTISRFLSVLLEHEIAFNLRSKIGDSNIAIELSKLFELIQSNRYNYEHYCTLLRLVVKKVFNIDIWNAVSDLIITVSRTISSISVSLSFSNTSVTKLFLFFQDSE